jgi:hypothetical protein
MDRTEHGLALFQQLWLVARKKRALDRCKGVSGLGTRHDLDALAFSTYKLRAVT